MFISKQELRTMRERAIVEQLKANDPSKDAEWLRAQQKSIDKMMQRKAKCPVGNVIIVDYEETTPRRRRDMLEKWLDHMQFFYNVDGHELTILLELPVLDTDANIVREETDPRRASDPIPASSRCSNSALPSRPSSFDSAQGSPKLLPLLKSASSKLSNSQPELKSYTSPRHQEGNNPTEQKWTANDQKWVETTQKKVLHQFRESGKNTTRNWCSVVITDTTEERNRRLLAWLKGLGFDCNLTSSVLHDEYFHIICTMNSRFYCILNEFFDK
jgi:hypothetical protein